MAAANTHDKGAQRQPDCAGGIPISRTLSATRGLLQTTFDEMLEDKLSQQAAAQELSQAVLSASDIMIAYDNMRGMLFRRAIELSSERHLEQLADLAFELQALPDAVNHTTEPIIFDDGWARVVNQPGDRIELLSEGNLWSGLPEFGREMTSYINNGPGCFLEEAERVLDDEATAGPKDVERLGEQRYTNINKFAAFVARRRPAENSPLFSCLECSLVTLRHLEHSPNGYQGRHSHLAVQAIAAWFEIAGTEVLQLDQYDNKSTSGTLWEKTGGTADASVRRRRFWKDRLLELMSSGRLSAEGSDSAARAIHNIELLAYR